MQLPPLPLSEVILLLALGAVIILITAELVSPYYGLTNLIISKKKLRKAALAVSVAFLIIVAIQMINIIA